ncbi:MAG: hypothetical protein P8Z35_15395 [Ignavibacteriaceae bacterium]
MTDKPTLICCKTTIGFGSPNKAGSHACHGAPLGQDEIIINQTHFFEFYFYSIENLLESFFTCKKYIVVSKMIKIKNKNP